MKAEADPWKVIVGFIIIIVCTILILFFFTDKFSSGSSRFNVNCWELEIPGKCFCSNEADCYDRELREKCKQEAVRACNE